MIRNTSILMEKNKKKMRNKKKYVNFNGEKWKKIDDIEIINLNWGKTKKKNK